MVRFCRPDSTSLEAAGCHAWKSRFPRPTVTAPGRCTSPTGTGPWPGVLVFPDAGGARETMRQMGDHLAGMGYVGAGARHLLPGGRVGARSTWPRCSPTPASGPGWGPWSRPLSNDRIVADAAAYAEFLLARPEVSGTAIGTTGYCLGGRMSMVAATGLGRTVAAAASFHGGRLAVDGDPSSPHLAADRITATVYVAGAKDDDSFTAEQAELLRGALAGAGVDFTVEFYPAASRVRGTGQPDLRRRGGGAPLGRARPALRFLRCLSQLVLTGC